MALSTLTTTYPNHLIIPGGDFEGDWTSHSDKSCHLRTLPFTRFEGPQLPTFTPAHFPSRETCIDHFLIFDPYNIAPQSKETQIIPHAFLDHNGVKTTIQLPLLLSPPPLHNKPHMRARSTKTHPVSIPNPTTFASPMVGGNERSYTTTHRPTTTRTRQTPLRNT